jgi:amidase
MPQLALADYAAADATDLAELIRRGEVSAAEVLDAFWRAVEACNGTLNAVTRPLPAYANAAIAQLDPSQPLAGVPIVLKDEYQHLPGVPTEHGARISRGFVAARKSELVARMERAGLVVVGKSNLPEFGASVTCEPVAHGICRNPWNLDRTSGASSGGSAAAVASRMVPLGYANDGAGSIRIPASCCGLFGLKPSRGRIPTGPHAAELWNGLVAEHVLTRSVRDSAAVLDAVHGADAGAPYAAPPAPASYLQALQRPPGRLRIGIATAPPAGGVAHPDVVAAATAAATLCEDLGHAVEWASPAHDAVAMNAAIGDLLALHLAHGVDELSLATGITAGPDSVEPANWALAERARRWPATKLLQLQAVFNSVCRDAAPFWERYDLWLTPTLGLPPVPHGHITPLLGDPDLYLQRWFEFCPFTPLANVLGAPSMSMPLHHGRDGLPAGVCFTAAFGREDLLLALAAQLEAALPWQARVPPTAVR